ncbi:MAG TPA: hypothetical protein VF069_23540 [Streptosporangiaceae bacterium]
MRPIAGGAFALATFVVALFPVRPIWLWLVFILVVAAVPWCLGLIVGPRPAPYWRLTATGLDRLDGRHDVITRYDHRRIEELAVTAEDGVLTVFHKFGRVAVGELAELGFEPLPLFVTARRFGIPIHVLDADVSTFADDDEPAPGRVSEQRLLDQEAKLLAAAHDPLIEPLTRPLPRSIAGPRTHPITQPVTEPVTEPVTRPVHAPATGSRTAPPPVRLESGGGAARGRLAALGALTALLATIMIFRIAVAGTEGSGLDFSARLAAAGWALLGSVTLITMRRRLLRGTPVRWEISADAIRVGTEQVAATDIAAVVLSPGLTVDRWTGEPRPAPLAALVFGYRQQLLARFPAGKLDEFQLAHALDEHGYRVITAGTRALKPSEYGLDGLPDVFAQVPGGRLVVHESGLGWADAAGDIVLRMPGDRIGGIELLTIGGHAWLRVYDAEGEEFFAAPLSVLRIARTELRESARQAGLSVTDAEYDAYLNAAFHGAVSAFATAIEPVAGDAAAGDPGAGDDAAAREPLPGEPARAVPAHEVMTVPAAEPGVLLDATWRSRLWASAATVVLPEIVSVLGALLLSRDVGGFAVALAWAAPGGLLVGLGGAWLYDRNRSQLRVSAAGIASITRRGKAEWTVQHETVGGVGIDDSEQGMPRLVIWSPAGRILRRVSFLTDLGALRRACERYGLPWGPPAADLPKPPPPEL